MAISCCLIGEDSLLIQCANILLTNNHQIELIVSPMKTIQDWSKKNNINCIATLDELLMHNFKKVDYIFSIVNSHILSEKIINLSRQGAINYHDSPLPKYAGLNSTTWAILNNEPAHGVTWHRVNAKVDEGDIIKQQAFPIHKEDTALTLNLRCYEHAIQSFAAMITDIEQGNLVFKKQALNNRSYFGASQIVPNFGFIDWDHFTAEFIVRINNALTLGHYNNNVGSLKIGLKNDYLIVSHVDISSIEFKASVHGSVVAIEGNALYISTLSRVIKIDSFISKNGHVLSVDNVVKQYGITVGFQFITMPNTVLQTFEDVYSRALISEKYWLNQLKGMTEHATFSLKGMQQDTYYEKLDSVISLDNLPKNIDHLTKKNTILTAILIYLYRLNDYERTSVLILHKDYQQLVNQCGNLFSCFLPLVIDWRVDLTLEKTINDVAKLIQCLEKYNTYLSDISARHPALENNLLEPGIVINLTGVMADISLPDNTILYFQFHTINNEVQVYHRTNLADQDIDLKDVLANITKHVFAILKQIITKPSSVLNNFCFLTLPERRKLLTDWGMGATKALPRESISELFEKQVAIQPNRPAIVMGNSVVSYHQLWTRSEKIASSIRLLNLCSQSLIGLYVMRSIDMIAIILGILKADCIYVPLDTKYPLLKIETIVNEAQLTHLITSENFFEKLDSHFKDSETITLHTLEKILASPDVNKSNTTKKNQEGLEKLAYIMFTSGTTGAPKGVTVTQKNIINYCQWFSETTGFNATSTIDFSSSIAFDLSVPCTLAPLLIGGRIAICDDAEKTNPMRYLQHLKNHHVTHAELTPGYLEMLLNYPENIRQLVDLKVLLLGADVVPSVDVLKWLDLCPDHQVVNEYGPTETTVSATSYFINRDAIVNGASVPIGRPAFNTNCYLLDKHNNLCPAGIKGELYIGGFQVTNGYFGKLDMTQEKFVDLSLNDHQEILYKTGDLACWLPDGNLQFFGRNDFQVKIQGYRIELTGIEAVLVKISSIHQAVVVVKQGLFKEKYLRAYLVSEDKGLSGRDIKVFLSSHLPSYMVPKEFCVTPSIPLKDNEKIDFEALENQPHCFLTFDHDVIEELSEFEKTSMRIWQQAFNNNTISSHDDFFDIGGDSLLALQIITELKKHYKIDIPLYYLFEYPTISLFSHKINELVMANEDTCSFNSLKESTAIIKLSTGDQGLPLFLVHPVGGSVFWYKQLAKCLEGKYTVYGIQDPSIDGSSIRFYSLEAMASYYLQKIETVYSGDAFFLGGASFGATVAFEMAYQLLNTNKNIEFLGLFDGWAEYPEELMKESTFNLLSQHEEDNQAYSKEKIDYLSQLEEYRKKLLLNYKLPILKTDVNLFKATELWESFSQLDDPYNGWRSFVSGEIITHNIQGNHETLFFDPNVQDLARCIPCIRMPLVVNRSTFPGQDHRAPRGAE